jgi:hypothetical protein
MFSQTEIRNIESATAAVMGPEFRSIDIVPVEFREHVLEHRAKKLGIVPTPSREQLKRKALLAEALSE